MEKKPRHRKKVNHFFKWLSPGIFVKRWLLTSIIGAFMIALGLAIWSNLTPVFRIFEFIFNTLDQITNYIPSHISGPLVLFLGLFLLLWGQTRTLGSITEVLKPDKDEELIDVLWHYRRLNKGTKIVAIGGGTGLSTLLRGLKEYSANITAIVTVADDGGSSGRLRREMGILPPGDIRNCMAALADEEKLLTELFQYRFTAGEGLNGHSFGNLFLTAMTNITGDLEGAIAKSSKVLAIQGKVLPATLEDVTLWARLEDGRVIYGESNIPDAGGKIVELGCNPTNPPATPAVVKAIQQAEYIILGPGSLYTSIIPNLLVPEIREAILNSSAPKIYVCNIMTQKGETDGYTVSDHIKAIDKVCGKKIFDAVLVQGRQPSPEALRKYAEKHCHPVYLDREEVEKLGRRIVKANVMSENRDSAYVRHDPQLLGKVLFRWYSNMPKSKFVKNSKQFLMDISRR
ncbi:gluconeogenesis factor YvcK family protein [Cyanobacterium aponinum]|uniref:Putative gluconeogenesis factor n=1 Tax=Cyanobacterium aponinum 0216 TaxID=2676140 RepID=A0A844GXI5_9CHRO|nr:gluconeogenesis factor YvcK family protein [Cyanobacterium aponinum]MTF39772.1 uridine diphosphate-N-acetylglucosamine-binding protein YvcK [Cyanobacterium aponinum 0216]